MFSTPSNRTRGRLWVFSKCRPHLFPPFEFFVLQTKEILFSVCSLRGLVKMTTEVKFQEQVFLKSLSFCWTHQKYKNGDLRRKSKEKQKVDEKCEKRMNDEEKWLIVSKTHECLRKIISFQLLYIWKENKLCPVR